MIPTANAPYCNRITLTNSVGRYLTARIEIADAMMIVIFLSLPKMSFAFRTVYVTKNMISSIRILAKKNSS